MASKEPYLTRKMTYDQILEAIIEETNKWHKLKDIWLEESSNRTSFRNMIEQHKIVCALYLSKGVRYIQHNYMKYGVHYLTCSDDAKQGERDYEVLKRKLEN